MKRFHTTFSILVTSCLFTFVIFFLPSCSNSDSSKSKCTTGTKVYIDLPAAYIIGSEYKDPTSGNKIQPGDTIVLKSSIERQYISFEDLHGTETCPIIITNEGGQVQLYNGFAFSNSTHIIVDGTGVSSVPYGFYITNFPDDADGPAIDINHRSSDIEIHHVNIYQKLYGMIVKQDPLCDEQYNYPNWEFKNIYIHDNQIKHVFQEGMYIGNTAPNGIGRTLTCCGKESCTSGDPGAETRSPIPARLSNVRVNSNIVENTGRAGIQYSAVASGDRNEIFHNHVRDTGFEHNGTQGPGISIGGVAYANICGNRVSHTWNTGINIGGAGPTRIENNFLEYCGTGDDDVTKPGTACIYLTTLQTLPEQIDLQVKVQNNTIAGPNTDVDIRAYLGLGTWDSSGNIFCDSATKNIQGGIHYSSSCNTGESPCDGIDFE